MQTIKLKPSEVLIRKGLDRYRKDMGDIDGLADSISRTRQILPIVISRDNELIEGGRRLAACAQLDIEVLCVYTDIVDECEMRELELEGNLQRKDFTPAEEAIAIRDLHRLKQERHGESTSGRQGGHTVADTAKLAGKSRAAITRALETAEILDVFPELASAQTQKEIRKAKKNLTKVIAAVEGKDKYEKAVQKHTNLFTLKEIDSVEYMHTVPDNSVDILLTDPLYGIEHDKLAMTTGGKTGGVSRTGFKFDDSVDKNLAIYNFLAQESFRFTAEKAHGYIFCGMEHFNTIRQMFIAAGWDVYIKPIIWIKRSSGQNNVPANWPSDCYEPIIYVRKKESKLVIEGQPNWIQCDIINPTERIHQYEKPVNLLRVLLSRVSYPGNTLFDPFMGSASSIEAAYKMQLISTGWDNTSAVYNAAVKRMADLIKAD